MPTNIDLFPTPEGLSSEASARYEEVADRAYELARVMPSATGHNGKMARHYLSRLMHLVHTIYEHGDISAEKMAAYVAEQNLRNNP